MGYCFQTRALMLTHFRCRYNIFLQRKKTTRLFFRCKVCWLNKGRSFSKFPSPQGNTSENEKILRLLHTEHQDTFQETQQRFPVWPKTSGSQHRGEIHVAIPHRALHLKNVQAPKPGSIRISAQEQHPPHWSNWIRFALASQLVTVKDTRHVGGADSFVLQ